MKNLKKIIKIALVALIFGLQGPYLSAQPSNPSQIIQNRLRVYYVQNPNGDNDGHAVALDNMESTFGNNPNMERAQQLVRAIFDSREEHPQFRTSLARALRAASRPYALFLYDDTDPLNAGVSQNWTNCINNGHFYACSTVDEGDEYGRILHYGAFQMNSENLDGTLAGLIRLLHHSRSRGGWWDRITEANTEQFEVCIPFSNSYEEFRQSVVQNSDEIRHGMISRSNPEYAEEVIDRRPFLREIHRSYSNLETPVGQEICLNGLIVRDNRRYVAIIRFEARDVHTFEDDPVIANTTPIQEEELNTLENNFDTLMEQALDEMTIIFGRPDSHDVSLSSVISVYCNNLIRLSRGRETMIPAEISQDFARPYRDRAQRDWNNLTQNSSAPALRGQDRQVIRACRSWAREVLREHGNTTDPSVIENYLQGLNGYRNY
ncbi:MAG: hypothetical protein AB3N14_14215 [Flavobacteriaceae bacterium]